MNIGFDAKRAYHNTTGLGYFSRTLLGLLSKYYPEHEYYLFNPKPSTLFNLQDKHFHQVLPQGFASKLFRSAWRSSWVTKDLQQLKIDLYHGLSHEIPVGIDKTGIKSVVTIHDLIHERHPEQYNRIDVKIYSRKFRYACNHADRIMAISQQTKNDIMEFYRVPAEKIVVCYQSCDPAFARQVSPEEKKIVKERFNLPERFFLYVGSVIERKNLLNICKAIFLLRNEMDIPLVVIGKGGKYEQLVKDYIRQQDLDRKIIFLSGKDAPKNKALIATTELVAIYQSAIAMVYPSFFEGFGAPVLEALWSRLPVITSNVSCLPEIGGSGAYYVDPSSAADIANGMKKIYNDNVLANILRDNGWKQAQLFTPEKYAASVMELYKSVW
jgi:glycosyltransferase involved in cell wall biosynthesis